MRLLHEFRGNAKSTGPTQPRNSRLQEALHTQLERLIGWCVARDTTYSTPKPLDEPQSTAIPARPTPSWPRNSHGRPNTFAEPHGPEHRDRPHNPNHHRPPHVLITCDCRRKAVCDHCSDNWCLRFRLWDTGRTMTSTAHKSQRKSWFGQQECCGGLKETFNGRPCGLTSQS